MIIKKNKGFKTTQMIEDDIRYSFHKILSQNHPIYSITISNTLIKSSEELRFSLTNKLFNRIHKDSLTNKLFNRIDKDYKNSYEVINYLFVIEYPEKISRGNFLPDKCDVHAHIVMGTNIQPQHIEYYMQTTFPNSSIFTKKIDDRNDKENLVNYLIKQKALLTDDNYNYKININ